MADREDKIGPIHRVEMERGDAAVDQIENLLGCDCGGYQLACGAVIVEALKAVGNPVRH